MLSFDSKGYLKPIGLVPSTVKEMREALVDSIDSEVRREHFQKYLKYSADLKKLLGGKPLTQWINGSFVTRKLNPKDIDFVTFIDHAQIKKLGHKLDSFRAGGSWENYGVDAYIIEVYPINSKHFKFTEYDLIEWREQFTVTRRNRKGEKFTKGFLEIIY